MEKGAEFRALLFFYGFIFGFSKSEYTEHRLKTEVGTNKITPQ